MVFSNAPAKLLDAFVDDLETGDPEPVRGIAIESMDHDHERTEEGEHTSRPQEDDDNRILEVLADEEIGAAWGSHFPYDPPLLVDPRKMLSWVSPLPDPGDVPENGQATVQGPAFSFLAAFLSNIRKVDIPFPQRYGLARFLLSCAERACYAWVHRWHPSYLDFLSIWKADDLELGWWIPLVKHLSIRGQLTHPPEASATREYWYSSYLEEIRHIAVHRLEYDTGVIRCVVNLAVNTNNRQLTSDIEQVLESLYIEECNRAYYQLDWLFQEEPQDQPSPLPEDAKVALHTTLGLLPTTPSTPHQLLGRLECILNNVCYNYTVARNDHTGRWFSKALVRGKFRKRRELTEPFEGELDRWRCHPCFHSGEAASESETCVRVRNRYEHKWGFYTNLEWLADFFRDSKRFAAVLEDSEAVETIEELENSSFPALEAQFAVRAKAFSECSESELEELVTHRGWWYTWMND